MVELLFRVNIINRKKCPYFEKAEILLAKKTKHIVMAEKIRVHEKALAHLTRGLYRSPASALRELVSNAWDADAKQVDVKLPLDAAWNSGNAEQIIEVADNGNGMTWNMVRDAYLDVGRDRREEEKTDRSPGGRLLQGRKGVGKLAGFGIADIVEVQTVHKDKDTKIGEKMRLKTQHSVAFF